MRIGVPEVANKTTQQVDTRALRTRLIAELANRRWTLCRRGCTAAAAQQRANELGVDYRRWPRSPSSGLEAGRLSKR